MKSNKIAVLLVILILVLLPVGASAFSLDLVGNVAVTSFDALVKAMPDRVGFDNGRGGWAIYGLDGKERIVFSRDFGSTNPDIALVFDADPFLKAGLDVTKLPAGQYHYDKTTREITMPFEYGANKFRATAKKSAVNTMKEIVRTHREIIIYHEQGDHYGIALDDGNMYAWAKNLSVNPKDVVFALNPKPLLDAGVDTGRIKDWVFGKIEVMDKDGRAIWMEKFLKGFNIK